MEQVVIAHNIRSAHNVGAILRSADGFGASKVFLTGYTPYPSQEEHDTRLPHERDKLTKQIHKTALGAETTVPTEYSPTVEPVLIQLKQNGYTIAGLEQDPLATPLAQAPAYNKIALLLGEEVHGIPRPLRALCDVLLEIPMRGRKESFNVSVAAGIALYELSKPQK